MRLDNRFVDLRTPANQAIFRVQSEVCQVRWQGQEALGARPVEQRGSEGSHASSTQGGGLVGVVQGRSGPCHAKLGPQARCRWSSEPLW